MDDRRTHAAYNEQGHGLLRSQATLHCGDLQPTHLMIKFHGVNSIAFYITIKHIQIK